ncbi:MAG: hypothetical protein R3300_13895 [Candidatus Promineifilaceae bacterium]|nr:hypothetical protein [Candidatus Promineifilaceae bacterium]
MLTKSIDALRRALDGQAWLGSGLAVGVLGLIISFSLEGLIPARPLGDPLPLVLVVAQLPRGLTYLAWQPALYHLLFSLALGLLVAVALRWRHPEQATRGQARLAGRLAMLLNVLIVALPVVDAAIVVLWYGLAGLVTVLVCGWVSSLTVAWRRA